MAMIDTDMGWFWIFKVTTYDLIEVTDGNDEYIDKSSNRASQFFRLGPHQDVPYALILLYVSKIVYLS